MAGFDAALAAERMVCAAEAMGLGICYIGALRNGERFERSGALEPKAYRDYGSHSGNGYVMGHAPRTDTLSLNDTGLRNFRVKIARNLSTR